MRTLILLLVLALPAGAQQVLSAATTTCTQEGVVTSLHTRGGDREEAEVHEAEHRRQLAADPALCAELVALKSFTDLGSAEAGRALAHWMPRLLQLEVEAYCVAARVPIRRGVTPSAVFLRDQDLLIYQFDGQLDRGEVERAWRAECGRLYH